MRHNLMIAAAVTTALAGASGYALAAPPTLAQAASPAVGLFMSGSSAAKSAVVSTVQNSVCGGAANALTVTGSPNTNFLAISCTATSNVSGLSGQLVTVWYRLEGGSVTAAIPVATGKAINQLNLSDTSNIPCPANSTACTATVNGTSANNGIDDSFAGAVSRQNTNLGIADVEPAALVGNNYPSAYLPSVYGVATPSQMSSLTVQTLFQQVFGVYVNTNSTAFTTSERNNGTTMGSLSLSKEMLTNIFNGNVTNWQNANDTAGNAVAGSSLAITLTNREAGSGTRTSVDIYFTGDSCVSGVTALQDPAGATGDFFATGDVLTAANKTAGAITYASIDNTNITKFPNLTLVNLNGITPSNIAAAAGQYDFWMEANAVTGPQTTNQATLATFIVNAASSIATMPKQIDILAIPGNGSPTANNPSLPISGTATGSPPVYVNPYTRSGVSCNAPADSL